MEYHEKNPTIKRWQDEVKAERNKTPVHKALGKKKEDYPGKLVLPSHAKIMEGQKKSGMSDHNLKKEKIIYDRIQANRKK